MSNPQQVFLFTLPVSTHFWRASHAIAVLADAADLELLFITGQHPTQLYIGAATDVAPAVLTLFEGTTVSASGTGLAEIDMNRVNPQVPGATAFHTPTITGDGTLIATVDLQAGVVKQGVLAADMQTPVSIILAANTNYMLRLLNSSGGAAAVRSTLFWAETPRT